MGWARQCAICGEILDAGDPCWVQEDSSAVLCLYCASKRVQSLERKPAKEPAPVLEPEPEPLPLTRRQEVQVAKWAS